LVSDEEVPVGGVEVKEVFEESGKVVVLVSGLLLLSTLVLLTEVVPYIS